METVRYATIDVRSSRPSEESRGYIRSKMGPSSKQRRNKRVECPESVEALEASGEEG